MSEYMFREAKRENVSLLIGLAGASGSGKTFSAMRLASGIIGKGKRFAVIDTEARRALHYADQFSFDHCELHPPFTPERYADAIKAADAAGYGAIVVDSVSHEWAGEGGILDMQEAELYRMAKDDFKRRESCKMAAWIKPKMGHKKMVQRLLQVSAHLILCFRAEEKIEMVRKDGKMQILKKQGITGLDGWFPICEKNLPYELTASFLLMADRPGYGHALKLQEQHKTAFDLTKPIDEDAGKRLREWAKGGEKQEETLGTILSDALDADVSDLPEFCYIDAAGEIRQLDSIEQFYRFWENAIAQMKVRTDAIAQIGAAVKRNKAVLDRLKESHPKQMEELGNLINFTLSILKEDTGNEG